MATRLLETSTPDSMDNLFMKVRKRIDIIFDSLIEKVNERREFFLRQLNEWEEKFNSTRDVHNQSLEKIKKERKEMEALLSKLTMDMARTSMEKEIEDLSKKISEKEKQIEYPQIRFACDTRDELYLHFSKFGSLTIDTEDVLFKNCTKLSNPVKVFGTFGSGKGEFSRPRGVVIDNNSQRILIADKGNSRIQVWSMEGRYLSEFGGGILKEPWEIVLSDDSIYISDIEGQFLSKWRKNNFTFVNKSETSRGSKPGQLDYPCGLDIDEEEIFVVEYLNNRISVFDLHLNFKRIMADKAIDYSNCLRVRYGTIYIVEGTGTIKQFSKTGLLLRIICPKIPFKSDAIYQFDFDLQLNFLLTDCNNNSLFVFSPEGDLIHSVGFTEFELSKPFGIDVSKNGRIVISFREGSNAVAIF